MRIVYPVLVGEIARRGLKRTAIARHLGMSSRALYNKLSGFASFTWDEICSMSDAYFPDIDKDDLLKRADTQEGA